MAQRGGCLVKLRNLPPDTTVDDITRLVIPFGEVTRIAVNPVNASSPDAAAAEAIVTFDEAADAAEAVGNLDGAEVGERFIEVAYFKK